MYLKKMALLLLTGSALSLSACQKAKMTKVQPPPPTTAQNVAPTVPYTPPVVHPPINPLPPATNNYPTIPVVTTPPATPTITTTTVTETDHDIDTQEETTPVVDEPYNPPVDNTPFDRNSVLPPRQSAQLPELQSPNIVSWFDFPIAAKLHSCGGPDCPPQHIPIPTPRPDEDCRENTLCEAKQIVRKCEPIHLSAEPITNKIDILFVVDTSASLNDERTEIANQMNAFVNKLNPKADYRIGVMLGHGPKETIENGKRKSYPKNIHGELYSSSKTDPAVLAFDSTYKDEKAHAHGQYTDQDLVNRAKERIRYALKNKMMTIKKAVDHSKAQGEAGLLSLYDGLTQPTLRKRMQHQGFLRSDAALAVIFVSDEQDVCYDYQKYGGKPNYKLRHKGEKTTPPIGRDPVEQITFDGICKTAVHGRRLTPEDVYQALSQLKGQMPLILTGILYVDNNIPKRGDTYAPENEMGRGYLNVIRMGHGQAASLADRHFGTSLAKLGDFSNFRMQYDNSFVCRTDVPADEVNESSVDVKVTPRRGGQALEFKSVCDGQSKSCPAGVQPAFVELETKDGQAKAVHVSVPYEPLSQFLNGQDATVNIQFIQLKK